jgi:hypothetical protein
MPQYDEGDEVAKTSGYTYRSRLKNIQYIFFIDKLFYKYFP